MLKRAEFSLDALRSVLNIWGRPHKKIPVISVAGTNGKGSTAAMIESILRESGVKTGLYTSPHLFNFRERIKINGMNIPYREVKKYIELLRKKEVAAEVKLSKFEIITAIAIKYFYDLGCEFCIMEAGLGGRLDATNIVENKLVAVICPIAVEHTDYLGNKIESIAKEKADIIRPGSFVVDNSGTETISTIARKKGCRIFKEGQDYRLESITPAGEGNYSFNYNIGKEFKITGLAPGLKGRFQSYNAAAALSAAVLAGFKNKDNIRRGIKKTYLPGRFEIRKVHSRAIDIVDAGHNPAALKEILREVKFLSPSRILLVMGVYKDKDYKQMAKLLKSHTEKAFIFTPAGSRALPAQILARNFGSKGAVFKDFNSAYNSALSYRDNKDIIFITGSFSAARPAMEFYR